MTTKSSGGIVASYGVECRDGDGDLIVRMVSLKSPSPPTCINPSCIWKYLWAYLTYAIIALYDSKRVYYATHSGRGKNILERYRTGEPMPTNLWQAIHANIKLKCPICRKYNVDPLLFSNMYKEKTNVPND